MANLFDKIHPNFFNVLASPNKKMYLDCIFIIYNSVDSIEESFQGDREYVVQKLIDYFDDIAEEDFVLDTTNDIKTSTSRQKANYVINVLKQNGWIGEEELGDYKTSINLFDYSIRVINLLDDILNSRQEEYTGEIFSVYSILKNFNIIEGIGVIEQAFIKTNDLIRKLKTLKANIYRYYYDVTRNRNKDELQNILEKLLIEYKQNFFDLAYYNLKTRDSLPRYKRAILAEISKIYDNVNTMDELAHRVMESKRINDYNEAFDYLETKLRFISDSFNALDNLILDIDRKNEQYISATASKILFLTNHSDDIEGIFNRLFKLVLKDDEFEFNTILNVAQVRNLDTYSLFNARRPRIDAEPDELIITDDLMDDNERRRYLEKLLKNSAYSKSEINKYVSNLLNGSSSVKASELKIETQDDYIRLILIFLYSKSINMDYEVKSLGDEVLNNFVIFRDFLIMSR